MGVVVRLARDLRLSCAVFALLLLAFHTHAQEGESKMAVSATVVRPCLISSSQSAGTLSDGEIRTVDCGENPRLKTPAVRPQLRTCNARSIELWCLHLRAGHSNHEILVVRFD